MSVPRPHVTEIKQWLKSRHVIVPLEWVEACVAFLNEEYNNQNIPLHQLKSYVYEQWLVADLEEIGISTLPLDISSCQKKILNGVFVLQVNGVRDIGKPAYAQLRELEGSTNADVEVTAAPKPFTPEWESKPKRMLLLNLTDGINYIQGMEYKPITLLSPNLSPGTKVLVKGPLECRFGMLLLTSDKIEVLGGEVDKHQQKYSRIEILREALNHWWSRLYGPGVSNSQAGSAADELSSGNSARNEDGERRHATTSNSASLARNQQEMLYRPADNGSSGVAAADNNNSDHEGIPDNFDDDDFVQDIDYSVLDEIERANSQQTPTTLANSQKENAVSSTESKRLQSPTVSPCAGTVSDREGLSESCRPSEMHQFSAPFIYLDQLPQDEQISSESSVIIKGSISKVLSRLECKSLGGWHLTARVSDSRSSIDVDFHDKVLEEFVGVPAKDMMAMQIEARSNDTVKSRIMEAISSCKKKLQKLNCLMEIKFNPGARPCVVKCFGD